MCAWAGGCAYYVELMAVGVNNPAHSADGFIICRLICSGYDWLLSISAADVIRARTPLSRPWERTLKGGIVWVTVPHRHAQQSRTNGIGMMAQTGLGVCHLRLSDCTLRQRERVDED